jgi:hypothetical protein
VSGVYFAKLTTDSGNFQNMTPFIVRNDGTPRTFCSRPATRPGKHIIPGADIICIKVPVVRTVIVPYAVSYNRPIAMNATALLGGTPDTSTSISPTSTGVRVDIGPDGWRVVGSPPVRFRRPAGILPLAVRSAAHPLINRSGFRSLPGLALLISAH